eukprot:m.307626 g.307626  ORF g.307626 m.307626 type:complete len:763 (-) comp16463_c1_seq11:65-2353(-)
MFTFVRSTAVFMFFASFISVHVKGTEASTVYVSPTGSDASGTGTETSPFRTLHHTQQHVRGLITSMTDSCENINVVIGEGVYYVLNETEAHETLLFNKSDTFEHGGCKVTWGGNSEDENILLSGGVPVLGWSKELSQSSTDTDSVSVWSASLPQGVSTNVRALRIGKQQGIHARYPDLGNNVDGGDGPFLFVSVSDALPNPAGPPLSNFSHAVIGIPTRDAPKWTNWDNAYVFIYPYYSWFNYRQKVAPLARDLVPKSVLRTGLTYYNVSCSQPACASKYSGILPGNRFFFFGSEDALDTPNEWALDMQTRILKIVLPSGVSPDVTIPLGTTIITINNNTSPLVIQNVNFMDTDYISDGYQSGWNLVNSRGIPNDTAVVLSGVCDVTIENCSFVELSGGGILLKNNSNSVLITNNKFTNIGQSGIMMVGETAIQPTNISVTRNTFHTFGKTMASAAAIYACTTSYSYFAHNNITDGPRWGIHLRSQSSIALSMHNIIEFNRVTNVARRTRDLGAISTMGERTQTNTQNTIRYNCVRNVIGMDADSNGTIRQRYYSWGIYLDNWSSGYHVYGNVVAETAAALIFVHGGRANNITNNIFVNNSDPLYVNSSGPLQQWGQIAISQMNSGTPVQVPHSNSFVRNIVYFTSINTSTFSILHTASRKPLNTTTLHIWLPHMNHNVYWNTKWQKQGVAKQVFPEYYANNGTLMKGNSYNWQRAGMDVNSYFGVDPGFADADGGDWRLVAGGGADAVDFVPLPMPFFSSC